MKLFVAVLLVLAVSVSGKDSKLGKRQGKQNGNAADGAGNASDNASERGKKTMEFKAHPNDKVRPAEARRMLGQSKFKVRGKEIQVFSEDMILDLQKALHKLHKCQSKPGGKETTVDDTPFTVDADVIPTLEEVESMLAQCEAAKSPSGNRAKRQVIGNTSKFWPVDKPIKMLLSDHAKTAENVVGYFKTMVAEFKAKTCIDIELVDSPPTEPYILVITELTGADAGCWTYAGRSTGAGSKYIPEQYRDENAHTIFISEGCWSYDTVTHEFLHALGLHHEQSRADRLTYIDIHWDNIAEYGKSQYDDCSARGCTNAPNPYDPLSVMHYGRRGFAEDYDKPTMSPKSAFPWNNLMGAAVDLSFSDYFRLNDIYCKSKCPSASCGVGYANPNNCAECLCPDGVGQGSCDNPLPNFICGGIKKSTSEWQTLSFVNTRQDPDPNHCDWVIEAPEGQQVELETRTSKIFEDSNPVEPCYWAAFEVRTKDFASPTDAFCGTEVSNKTYVSESRRLLAVYRYNLWYTNTTFDVYYRTKQSNGEAPATTTTESPAKSTDSPAEPACQDGMYRCPGASYWYGYPEVIVLSDGSSCIDKSWRCDGIDDCRDGHADEQNC